MHYSPYGSFCLTMRCYWSQHNVSSHCQEIYMIPYFIIALLYSMWSTTCSGETLPVYKDQIIWIMWDKWSLVAISLSDETEEIMSKSYECTTLSNPIENAVVFSFSYNVHVLCIQIQKHSLSQYNFCGINCSILKTTTITGITLWSLTRSTHTIAAITRYYHCPDTTTIKLSWASAT